MFDLSLIWVTEQGYPVLDAYFTGEKRKQFEQNVQIM
jgi:hypothetical protein